MATYVSLVNDAIDESGSDLGLFQTDGSDFTTNTGPQLNRFKKWVARSWEKIQQVAFDWQFMDNQGLVTVNPGLMFYTEGAIEGELATSITFYGTDDSTLFSSVPVNSYKDLTYSQYSDTIDKSFGYVNLTSSGTTPVDSSYTFKAGGDYFNLEDRLYQYSVGAQLPDFYAQGVLPGDTMSMVVLYGGTYYASQNSAVLVSVDPDVDSASKGSDGFVFLSEDPDLVAAYDDGTFTLALYADSSVLDGWVQADAFPSGSVAGYESIDPLASIDRTLTSAKAYLHSWKSFDFSEEIGDDDYQGEICEINPVTFQMIDHESDSPSTVRNLTFVPWEVYSMRYDRLTTPVGTPIYITEDNTGRYRLYPHPDRPVTLKFEFNRLPQTLVEFDDVPKGLPNDFMELIMWLAIRMYGEFDEQPSVQRRAERYYKDMLQRLQIKYRPKFRLTPKRLY